MRGSISCLRAALVHSVAAIAEAERKAIASRTKEAFAAAKARGQTLGNPKGAAALRRAAKGNSAAVAKIEADADAFALRLVQHIERKRAAGLHSFSALARGLNEGGFKTTRGGRWHPSSVSNWLARQAAAHGNRPGALPCFGWSPKDEADREPLPSALAA